MNARFWVVNNEKDQYVHDSGLLVCEHASVNVWAFNFSRLWFVNPLGAYDCGITCKGL